MPRRYWLPIVAAVGFLSFVVLLAGGYYVLWQVQQQSYAPDKYQPSRDANLAIPAKDGKVATEAYQPNCQAPQHYRDADLCAQWGSVKASEEGNRLIRVSTRVTYLEFVGLVISLIFTGWAAVAASKGTKAANLAVKQSEEHTRIGLKAYLSVNPHRIEWTPKISIGNSRSLVFGINCNVENTGNTPAEDVRICADIKVVRWPPNADTVVCKSTPQNLSNQGVGQKSAQNHRFVKDIIFDLDRLKSGADRILITGKMTYRDYWKELHTVEFVGSIADVAKTLDALEVSDPEVRKRDIEKAEAKFDWYHAEEGNQPNSDEKF